MSLALKYRPKKFSEVVGQQTSVKIMVNSVLYDRPRSLFLSGIRGTGKTTLARLYAKALNCERFRELGDVCCACSSCQEGGNVLELDAASNAGVEDARELENIVRQVPMYKFNVTVLDECHMLSKQAQNVLLKVLEEAPRHSVFVLVTTEPSKLLDTVRSRCLSMPLRPLSVEDAAHSIRSVLTAEQMEFEDRFVASLALSCEGSLRDVYQLLEQAILGSIGGVLKEEILEDLVGVVSKNQYKSLASVLCSKNYYGVQEGLRVALDAVNQWEQKGYDIRNIFLTGVPNLLRDFTVKLVGSHGDGVEYLSGISDKMFSDKLSFTMADVNSFMREWDTAERMMRTTSHPKVAWEVFLVKAFMGNDTVERGTSDY